MLPIRAYTRARHGIAMVLFTWNFVCHSPRAVGLVRALGITDSGIIAIACLRAVAILTSGVVAWDRAS